MFSANTRVLATTPRLATKPQRGDLLVAINTQYAIKSRRDDLFIL